MCRRCRRSWPIMPAAISCISAMALFMRMSAMAPRRPSILARGTLDRHVRGPSACSGRWLRRLRAGGGSSCNSRSTVCKRSAYWSAAALLPAFRLAAALARRSFWSPLELAHLAHQPLGQAGMGGEALG